MNVVKLLIILVLAYLMGSLSSSILLSRGAWGGDVRSKGSGNAGATNMARVYGWAAGVLTLVCDMAKAGLSVWIGWKLMGDWGLALGGIACMAGHCFPLFHEFKGGKGISVGAALGLAIDWRVFVAIVVVFLIVALLTRKVSAGSCAAAVAITAASRSCFSRSRPCASHSSSTGATSNALPPAPSRISKRRTTRKRKNKASKGMCRARPLYRFRFF